MILSAEQIQALRADPASAPLLYELEKIDATVADLRAQNGLGFLEVDWKIRPHPKQRTFYYSTKAKAMFSGAQGSGKSHILCSIAAAIATHAHPTIKIPDPVDIWIVALNYKKVDQVLLPILRRLLPKGMEKSWDSQSYVMVLHNGNTISFMSADAGADKFQSNRLDVILFDEAPQKASGVAVYKECLSRFKPGRTLYIRMAVTPWEMPRFFRDEFYVGKETNSAEVDCITVGLADNPYITPKQLAYQKRQYVGKEYRARILGEVVDLTGLVFDTISSKHLIDDFEIPSHWPRFCGIDPTEGRRPWSIVWATMSPAGVLYFYDELEVPGTYGQIVSTIKTKEAHQVIEYRAIDPFASKHDLQTGNPWTTELLNLGLATQKVDRSKRSFYRTIMSTRLGDPESGIEPKCYFFKIGAERTYTSFANHNWQDWAAGNDGRAAKEKEEDSQWKDLVDAALYLIALNPEYHDVRDFIMRREEREETFQPIDPVVAY